MLYLGIACQSHLKEKITMLSTDQLQSLREKMKQSRAKIWIRTGLLTIFSVIFGMYLVRDISSGIFRWEWGLAVFVLCFPVGMWMSRLVPMQAQSAEIVTLSFDRIYFVLIWLLVIAKFILGRIPGMNLAADIIMCSILGIMSGRPGGIGLRVRSLKNEQARLNEPTLSEK
jgi:undecaprenyl pyrophosphate phosphatase UppP